MGALHTTPFAGYWYPGSRGELEALIDRLFESSRQRTGCGTLPRPLGFVVPHAGLVYSGTVAASAYRHLEAEKPERVFILGFSHRGSRPGVLIPDVRAIGTPLGETPVDSEAVRELAFEEPFTMVAEDLVCDHSVEIQLPLLQRAAPGAPVVPLYVGHLDDEERRAAALSLARRMRPGDVLLASSDFTHYGRAFGYEPFAPDEDVCRNLSALDAGVIDAASSLDSGFFLDTLSGLDSTVCGYEPIALLLETLSALAGEDVFQQTLDYQTSADLTGDFQNSVSYASLGYFREDSFCLAREDQESLIVSASATLRHLVETGERRPIPAEGKSASLMRQASVFVSLHEGSELFGCIGTPGGRLPLAESVPRMTLAAALDDPRFERRASIPEGLKVEISVLTPTRRIPDWRLFRLGRDGASLECEGRRAVLLPQVAGQDIDTEVRFLEALSRKAGLPAGAYGDAPARLSVFRAQRFGCSVELKKPH